eukprot:gene2315-2665_t
MYTSKYLTIITDFISVVNESPSEDEAIGIVLPLSMVTSMPAEETLKRKKSIYCICKQKKSPEEENNMIKCESRRKDVRKFHLFLIRLRMLTAKRLLGGLVIAQKPMTTEDGRVKKRQSRLP